MTTLSKKEQAKKDILEMTNAVGSMTQASILKKVVSDPTGRRALKELLEEGKMKRFVNSGTGGTICWENITQVETKEVPIDKEKPTSLRERLQKAIELGIKPVKREKIKFKKETGPSNKEIVYLLWVQENEKNIDVLHEKVQEKVKKSTIRSWCSGWVKGKNLPACAKKEVI